MPAALRLSRQMRQRSGSVTREGCTPASGKPPMFPALPGPLGGLQRTAPLSGRGAVGVPPATIADRLLLLKAFQNAFADDARLCDVLRDGSASCPLAICPSGGSFDLRVRHEPP